MAHLECRFFSKVLQLQMSMQVILPERGPGKLGIPWNIRKPEYPVLWLYHGMSDNDTAWMRNTSIERYAEDYGLAVVMPDVHRSYYTDMAQGGRYWKYVSDEVVRKARTFFPLSVDRDKNFVAGLSMGGFGAFKMALLKPELISAAGSFSGSLDIPARFRIGPAGRLEEFRRIFGPDERVGKSRNDLPYQLSRHPKGLSLPRLFQCCGTEDFLIEPNRTFSEEAAQFAIPLTYIEDPGYAHTWDYWDLKIEQFLQWLADGISDS